jgi:cytochrome c oxidase cbb3-type subunit 3
MAKQDKPKHAPDTGHEWDGIRELTNPPPRWWMLSLHASWIFALVYILLYPSIPLVHESTKGLLGWTQIKEYKAAVAEGDAIKAPYMKKVSAMSGQELLADASMRNFSESSAHAIFGDFCAGCHGAGGQGAPGLFPALADDDWLYGGNMKTIIKTITKGRKGKMPAFATKLSDADIEQLADFTLAASNGMATPEQFEHFHKSKCTLCHGKDATGNKVGSGAANLTDSIWRFSSDRDEIIRTIRHGVNYKKDPDTRVAIMPSFKDKLTPEQIKMLAVKVHQFGGGQ